MNHSQLLRWSLLGSLGFVPVACSGSSDAPDADGQAGANNEAGAPAASGSTSTPNAEAGIGGGSETVAAGAGGGGNRPSCTSPTTDPITGLTTCAEGYRFRAEAIACAPTDDAAGGASGVGGASGAGGQSNGELFPEPTCAPACTAPGSFCARLSYLTASTGCLTRCDSDSECADNELCLCGGYGVSVCVPASCRSDADCDDGYHCAQEPNCDMNGLGKFSCQKAEDECFSSDDCSMCESVVANVGHRKCAQFACGRPFLVASAPRVAPIVRRADWLVRPTGRAA